LAAERGCTVRVRTEGRRAFLTVKGPSRGLARPEFEYGIPLSDARWMLAHMCGNRIVEKRRYRVAFAGAVWEVDEFLGRNAGLVVAEIELASERQRIDLPPWAGSDVTGERRYLNAVLSQRPFSSWPDRVKRQSRSDVPTRSPRRAAGGGHRAAGSV
jgi:adenylate cyclase